MADVRPSLDGRRARAERSREAVLDAVLELYREGDHRPSVDDIAERAGVSRRSVFRYFDDLESLTAAVLHRHLVRIAPLAEAPPAEGDVAARASALAERRSLLYEEITPSRLVTQRLRGRVPMIDAQLERARLLFRGQIEGLFAEELATFDPVVVDDVVVTLEAATSWEVWHVLRHDLACDVERSQRLVVRNVLALLGC